MLTNVSATAIDDDEFELPSALRLNQNYPNPFNPSTAIPFELDSPQVVTLRVFDVTGKEVDLLVDGLLSAGSYSIPWEPSRLPTGVYQARLESATGVRTMMMTYLR